jgi:hypothetical protein
MAALSLSMLAAGCGATTTPAAPQEVVTETTVSKPTERASTTPRLALSYDGGILVLDATTLAQVADIPVDGFVRLNSAANGRHVLVSQSDGFVVLDMGTWTDRHGDHAHHFTSAPQLTDVRFGGAEPGHVIAHDDLLTLFSDGTGAVDVVDPDVLLDGEPSVRSATVTEPHHGVAVARADGSVVVSVGNDETRSGIEILDASGRQVAANDQCPGLHGEATAADGVLTFGCQDGILVVCGNDIRKVASRHPYGRIGNQSGSAASPVVLGDYKTNEDAELERPRRFTLTDTATGTLTVVDFDASYSFRSLDRGPRGEAVVLGTDGALHVFDPVTARRVARIDAVGSWTEPDEWQSPMPNLHVQDGIAYVSDPGAQRLVAVRLDDGSKVADTVLEHPTIELTGVGG